MTDLDRRTVLRGAAVSGAIGVYPLLAGCGSDDADTGGSGTSSPTASASSPSETAGGGADTPALASTADIPVGGGTVFADAEVVVTQPTKGSFKGYTAVCTHQGCLVGDVSDGTINCPCHGSMFDIADGSVAGGPAQAPLPSKPITVQDGSITLA